MKFLFLKHNSIAPYFVKLNEEIQLFQQWLVKIGIPYEIEYKDFDDRLEYQGYNNDAFYCLSQDFMRKMSGKYANPGDYHLIYVFHNPTHEKSAGVFTTHYYNDFNGSVCIDMPTTIADADRADHWVWRALAHETIHGFFGILKNAWKINIIDYQDAAYGEYHKAHPTCTEDDLTQLSESIYHTSIEPYKNKLIADVPIKAQATLMMALIGLLTQLVAALKQRLANKTQRTKEQVINDLANAIATFEGFFVANSRGQRNHNPGNLMYVGQSKATKDNDGFCVFASDSDGWETLYNQLWLIWNGQSRYYNVEMTIQNFVDVWSSTSPLEERKNYAQYIAQKFGVSVDTPLKQLK